MKSVLTHLLLPLLGWLCLACGERNVLDAQPLRIAAASDLAPVLPELIALHQERDPREITTTLGSSGLLARQIAQGAPFDVFFSANVAFVDELVANGHARAETRTLYARGRIALWSRMGAMEGADGLEDLLDPRFKRIAIANPEHAPYGLAAKQALQSAAVWDPLLPRIVYGDNILQTLQICQSGNAEFAIIALSLAMAAEGGRWALLDEELHAPIDQGLVVTQQSALHHAASEFAHTVQSPAGREILARYGFVLPGETLDPAVVQAAGGRIAR